MDDAKKHGMGPINVMVEQTGCFVRVTFRLDTPVVAMGFGRWVSAQIKAGAINIPLSEPMVGGEVKESG